MMESWTYRKTANADKEHQWYAQFLKQANPKVPVVWIALNEDDQQIIHKNPTIPPGQKMDEDRPKYWTIPYPVHVRVNIFNTFTLVQHITSLL